MVVCRADPLLKVPAGWDEGVYLKSRRFKVGLKVEGTVRHQTDQAGTEGRLFFTNAHITDDPRGPRTGGHFGSLRFPKLLHQLGQHGVSVQLRPGGEVAPALGTETASLLSGLVPVVPDAGRAVAVSTGNSDWICQQVQADRAAQLLHVHRNVCVRHLSRSSFATRFTFTFVCKQRQDTPSTTLDHGRQLLVTPLYLQATPHKFRTRTIKTLTELFKGFIRKELCRN